MNFAKPEKWTESALCTDTHPDLWYPEKTTDPRSLRTPREICGRCEVRLECLTYAMRAEGDLDFRSRHGIWGGLTPLERHKLAERKSA